VRWAIGAAVAFVAAAAAIGILLVRAPSGRGEPSIVVALHGGPLTDCASTRLRRIDPATLEPRRGGLRLDGFFSEPVPSPDGKSVALGGAEGSIAVADVANMRRLRSVRIGSPYESTEVVAWPPTNRLIALDVSSDAHRVGLTKVVVLDPERGEVIRELRVPWWAAVGRGTSRSGRVAVLLVSWRHLVPPRLVVVGRDGRLQTVRLTRLRAGIGYARYERIRFPGFAVDPNGERAFVVNEGEPAAIVDLATLHVRYRKVAGLAQPARALAGPAKDTGTSNPRQGPARVAAWLGRGLIAISGYDSYVGQAERWLGDSKAPAGLQILDTGTWRARTVARHPSDFEWVSGRLLASARAWDPRTRRTRGDSLVAFDREGGLVFRIRRTAYWQTFNGRIYVGDRSGRDLVLDARTGRRLGRVSDERVAAVTSAYC
jgi:hypothetical protein